MAFPERTPAFSLQLSGDERDDFPALSEVAYFLNDLNLLYEYTRLLVDPKYENYRFSKRSSERNAGRISWEDQLYVRQISKQSPIALGLILKETAIAVPIIWIFTQTLDKIWNWRVDRDIKLMQREKLRMELAGTSPMPLPEMDEREILHLRKRRRATMYFRDIEEKLAAAP